jgi:peptidoglycan/LPS O-acetylase OafA/YrhL
MLRRNFSHHGRYPVTPSPNRSDRIPTLDGLRAAAIVIVMVSHVFQDNKKFAALGHMGVLIFFALSGYLITTRLLVEYRSSGRISLRNFYLRRAFRILPPAAVYLGILSVLSALGIVICSGPVILSALLFYTNYIDIVPTGWMAGHFWSLSVEEHFYMFWPLLLIVFGVRTGWRTAIALVFAILLWRLADFRFHILASALHEPYLQWFPFRTDLIADALLWGCCLAFLSLKTGRVVSTVAALGSACLLVLLCQGVRLPFPPHNAAYLALIEHLLPALIVGAIVACPTAPIGRLLELTPVRFIGNLSYSLYIWQQMFLWGPGGQHMSAPLGIAAAFVCAYLSYRFIEQPCIRFGKRFIAGRQPVAVSRPIVETS